MKVAPQMGLSSGLSNAASASQPSGGSGVVLESSWSRWIRRRLPPLHAFLKLPLLPHSPIPFGFDGGVTRTRHIVSMVLSEPTSRVGVAIFAFLTTTILLSVFTFCTQTMVVYRIRRQQGQMGVAEHFFLGIEQFCVALFTVDYVGRLLTTTARPPKDMLARMWDPKIGFLNSGWNRFGGITGRAFAVALAQSNFLHVLKWLINPMNVLDLASILPFYVNLFVPFSATGGSMAILRVLRLGRVLGVMRQNSSFQGIIVMGQALAAAGDALVSMLVMLMLAVVLLGSAIYYCECGTWDPVNGYFARPNLLHSGFEQTPFQSIPHAFWYTLVTMTTVGYGDFYPTSDWGRSIGALTMICGILVIAMPVSVIGATFAVEFEKMKELVAAERQRVAALKEAEEAEHERNEQLDYGGPKAVRAAEVLADRALATQAAAAVAARVAAAAAAAASSSSSAGAAAPFSASASTASAAASSASVSVPVQGKVVARGTSATSLAHSGAATEASRLEHEARLELLLARLEARIADAVRVVVVDALAAQRLADLRNEAAARAATLPAIEAQVAAEEAAFLSEE